MQVLALVDSSCSVPEIREAIVYFVEISIETPICAATYFFRANSNGPHAQRQGKKESAIVAECAPSLFIFITLRSNCLQEEIKACVVQAS